MNTVEVIKKKRGRRPNIIKENTDCQVNTIEHIDTLEVTNTDDLNNNIEPSSPEDQDIKVPKKRGRKPKGGKIILNSISEETNVIHEPNIILHLKSVSAILRASGFGVPFNGESAK
jgi:hypothetical protein